MLYTLVKTFVNKIELKIRIKKYFNNSSLHHQNNQLVVHDLPEVSDLQPTVTVYKSAFLKVYVQVIHVNNLSVDWLVNIQKRVVFFFFFPNLLPVSAGSHYRDLGSDLSDLKSPQVA